ncbi:hypothetical protein RFI_05076 [Reticulomyxa filosa]|uniref:Uncharacterized protein n=1 Tax=Reticulomyxa filosa TaxID=46433 RepID=X6P1U7_RETFI|nr:hypothetical protein RFI_05076 [Reticulomyxa filosa]|eukprot:ETO32039.1 hypothetical protein RFI_05076 [Reticulomyxa filosa]
MYRLSGTIPPEIYNLAELEELLLMGNVGLSGSISKEIKNLTKLKTLDLSINKLTGTILPEIGNLVTLQYLDLSQNWLSGTIPKEIGNLIGLNKLYLYLNELTGTIPIEIGNLRNLSVLEFSDNKLSGVIPLEIGNLYQLQFLVLENNQLNGKNIYAYNLILKYKYHLKKKKIRLSGELPRLDKLSFLRIIEINNNMLSGTISFADSYNWNYLTIFSLEKNMFIGDLPKLPNRMSSILVLTLHINQFSDHNLHDWLDELFHKASTLQILSIYDNPHLTGHLPNSIFDTHIQIFLAHGCEINGILPSSNSQGHIHFSTLLQNRLSGGIPNNLKVDNGMKYLKIKNYQNIISKDEKNAKNLYITKESMFTEIILIGFIMIITLFLFLRKSRRYSIIKRLCGNKMICCFKIRKLPDHVGFQQMKLLLKWFNNWFVAVIISSLVIIYAMNTTYYEKGYLLSHFSLAYIENLSLFTTTLLIIIVLLSNVVILIYAFQWTINPPFTTINTFDDNFDNETDPFTWQKGVILTLLFLGWILIAAIVVVYFAFESLPDNNTLHVSSNLIYMIQIIMSFSLSLHNSLIAPNFAIYAIEFIFYIFKINNLKLTQKYYSYVSLFLQTLICIIIPLFFASYFYNGCGRYWIHYWETCSGKDFNQSAVSYYWTYFDFMSSWSMNTEVTVLNWGDLCEYRGFQFSTCIREILEKWGNIMVIKMAINIFLPWTRLANIRAFLFQCESLKFLAGSNELNFETVGLFVNVELVILLGLFCPLIVPLCAMATISNILNFQYLLNKKIKHVITSKEDIVEKNNIYKLSDEIPEFPISVLIFPFLFQQIIWIFSGALSNNHSHLIKNIFGYSFLIIDICFIIAVIIQRYFYRIRQYGKIENESMTRDNEEESSTKYHLMKPMETQKDEF